MKNRIIKFRAWDRAKKEMMEIDNVDWEGGHDCFTDDRYIPMQYTGLKDKNGVEIYEGDIVEVKDWKGKREGVYEIKWEGSAFTQIFGGEVIGNIYQNKELLNGSSN